MNQEQADAWMAEHFPPVILPPPVGEPAWRWEKPVNPVSWIPQEHTRVSDYSGRRWIRTYIRKCMEDPGNKDRYFREAYRLRMLMKLGQYRVNTMDGTGRSFVVTPGLPLDHKWQYTSKDAR